MKFAAAVLVLALALVGCGRQRVATQPELPPLAPPAPPPRVVTPDEPEEQPPAAKPPETPARKPMRTPVRPAEPPREAPKPEEKPVAKPEVPPKPDTLQTQLPQPQPQMESQVNSLIVQANRDLSTFDYRNASKDAKGQYDQAKRFITQALQALKDQNYILAQRLAEKAATIAGVLVGR